MRVKCIYCNKSIDIKLITTTSGNVGVERATRNILHLLDLFDLDIPVAKGASKAMFRESIDASFLHGKEGMGGYVPPKTTKRQVIDSNAVDAIYSLICKYPNEITILVWGPHTNIAMLLEKYPECARLIKQIIFMGGSPYDTPGVPQHISFNIKSDPEAFKIVVESGIPMVMAPSNMGRYKVYLTEEQVKLMGKMNDVTKFLVKTYQTYWEPRVLQVLGEKRIATNDTCALYYLINPNLFVTYNAELKVDLEEEFLGRTYAKFGKNGHIKIMMEADRYKFINKFFKDLKKLDKLKYPTT